MHISEIRKVIGFAMLRTQRTGYVLEADAQLVDIHQFERLVEDGTAAIEAGSLPPGALLHDGLALWRGRLWPTCVRALRPD